MAKKRAKSTSFRVGCVRVFRRGRIWYLQYQEQGIRRQPRIGPERDLARQTAAEINAQLEVGCPSSLGFEPISIADLRERWLRFHEHVRRSSLNTIERYRAATQHLIHFIERVRPLRRASDLKPHHAEEFVEYLRSITVAPNGHCHTTKRKLRDNGVKYILETCCTLFNYAGRHRHLPPYAENPFRLLEIGRIPVEDARPIVVLDAELERQFLNACDDWQLPLFLTLLMTGLRPGELTHLLLPADLDLDTGWLHVRNKPRLGWQVKTRSERQVPLVPELVAVFKQALAGRTSGPVFRQRRCGDGHVVPLADRSAHDLEQELSRRLARRAAEAPDEPERQQFVAVAARVWRDSGALRDEWVRLEFIRVMRAVGHAEITAPKTLRHTFATALQDANVDPLVRNELMGHAPASFGGYGPSLGMTAVYTHTRPETKRRQLEQALNPRPALALARQWLAARSLSELVPATATSPDERSQC